MSVARQTCIPAEASKALEVAQLLGSDRIAVVKELVTQPVTISDSPQLYPYPHLDGRPRLQFPLEGAYPNVPSLHSRFLLDGGLHMLSFLLRQSFHLHLHAVPSVVRLPTGRIALELAKWVPEKRIESHLLQQYYRCSTLVGGHLSFHDLNRILHLKPRSSSPGLEVDYY